MNATENGQQVNLADWYNPVEAAKRLTRNSGREVKPDYLRKLAQYGKVRTLKLSSRATLYRKEDVDGYIVEAQGRKSGRAKKESAKSKPQAA
jgi:hypothetical protein